VKPEVAVDWECCWSKNEITPNECPFIAEGEKELYSVQKRRIIEKCLECPRFSSDLLKARQDGQPLVDILSMVIAELGDQKGQLHAMGSFLNSKTREIKFLHELNSVLQTSLDLDEVLSVAMTAITAGKGFGLNRAFLLMTDKDRHVLKGYLGVGPRDYEEAWQIWQEIGQNDLSLREMARNFQKTKLLSEKVKFHDLLEKLTVSLADQDHIFNRALREKKPVLVTKAFDNPEVDSRLAMALGVDSFLIMPLISRNRRIGVILADNCITQKPIALQDMQLLETFAFPVAFALERASLYERLQEEVDKQTEANVKLQEQQELILKMEKMALVGRITSSIAHSIRNPLMIIGGFARSLLKSATATDVNREYLESIVHEAKHLEESLEEVLNYADSLYPAKDSWDINQLVAGVFGKFRDSQEAQRITCSLDLAKQLPAAFIDYRQVSFCIRSVLATVMENSGIDSMSLTTRLDGDSIVIEIEGNGVPAPLPPGDGLLSVSPQELGGNLGLHLCKSILEQQGNPFLIETPPEGGARYMMRLPIRKESE